MGEVIPFKSKQQIGEDKETDELFDMLKSVFGLESSEDAKGMLRQAFEEIEKIGEINGKNK